MLRTFFAQGVSRDFKVFARFWLGWGLVFHTIAAVYSVGYHSADEYFQILEFVSFKLGLTPVQVLAVEFPERMRPWMQPGIYYTVVRFLQSLGIDNPFTWSIVIRWLTGFVGWLSTVALATLLPQWFVGPRADRLRRITLLGLVFLWYLPALHVRPSSESWGGSFFVLGICAVQWSKLGKWDWRGALGAGVAFALAFEFRFQMGIAIAGAGAWVLWQLFQESRKSAGLRWLGLFSVSFVAVFFVGRAVDAWGYGEWVWSPWNYLHYNLVRGEVNRYGRSPWWDVFRMATTEAWPLLGTLTVVAFVLAWMRNPRHLLTWSYAPFFLVHIAISHKELRFFFPIASAGPVLIALAARDLIFKNWPRWSRSVGLAACGLLVVNNGVGFVAGLFSPMSRSLLMYEQIWKRAPHELLAIEKDPYEVLGTPTFFYRPRGLKLTLVSDPEVAQSAIKNARSRGKSLSIFFTRLDLPAGWQSISMQCETAYETLPPGSRQLIEWGMLPRANAWSLRDCR